MCVGRASAERQKVPPQQLRVVDQESFAIPPYTSTCATGRGCCGKGESKQKVLQTKADLETTLLDAALDLEEAIQAPVGAPGVRWRGRREYFEKRNEVCVCHDPILEKDVEV